MRFRIDARLLRQHLEFVKPPKSRNAPILQAVSVIAYETDGSVFLSHRGTDWSVRTCVTAARHPLHPMMSGQAVVDWYRLFESIRSQKGTVTLEETLTRNEDEGERERRRLDVTLEETRVRLPLFDRDDLPCPVCLDPKRTHYMLRAPARKLTHLVKRALPMASRDHPRPPVRGIQVQSSRRGIRIAATDACHRAFAEEFGSPVRSDGDWQFVLPERFCRTLLRAAELMKQSRNDEIVLSTDAWQHSDVEARERERLQDRGALAPLPERVLGEGRVQATWGGIEILDTTPAGPYPRVERVLPHPGGQGARATISRLKLVELLRPHRPKPYDGCRCPDCVSLHFSPGRLGVVFRPGLEGTPISSILPSEEDRSPELSVALSAHGLLLALQAIPDEEVTLFARHPVSPVLLSGRTATAVVSAVGADHICPIDHPLWQAKAA